jgi:hypothetical protein
MIRNVVMVKLTEGADPEVVGAVQAGFRGLEPAGCVSYTLGDDLGLKAGAWSFAIVADFADEASYLAYDLDAEHNRLRGLLAPHAEQIARVQFAL